MRRPIGRAVVGILLVVAFTAPANLGTTARAATFMAEPVATGLEFPAGFTFDPSGRIFYGERLSGEIRVLDPDTGDDSLFFTVPNVTTTGEQGLLALALHPDYPTVPRVFVYVTRLVGGIPRDQLVRLTDNGGQGTGMQVLFDTPAADFHNGGRLLVGPDRKLYLTIGDLTTRANAQDLNSVAGKVLRLNLNGTAPAGNPIPGNPMFAYGLRNPFGFDFDPISGGLWLTDNGPECNDELNRIVRGRNHGWGLAATCATPPPAPTNTNQDGPNPIGPRRFYAVPHAPTGVAFCSTCQLDPGSEGTLFFAAWNTGQFRRVVLSADRVRVLSQQAVYDHPSGVIGVETAPDGRLYFSTATAIYRLVFA